MKSPRITPRRCFLFLLTFAVLLVSGTALGADRVVWKKRTVNESNESWRLDMEFHFSSPPDIAHVPIQFEFQQTVYYERSLVDGREGPQDRHVPMENKQPLIETQDVGFLDPGSGKTMSRTRFTFKLTRARGFEAGEYKVSVKNKRNNRKLGAPITLILKGENEVIDRRAISFEGEPKKKKKKEESQSEEEQYDPTQDPNNEAYWAQGPAESEKEKALPPPAHMQDKPGACGCRVPGVNPAAGTTPFALGLLLFGAVAVRRRRTL